MPSYCEGAYGKLLSFLQSVDTDFRPALSDKVYLPDYVRKIIENAALVVEEDGDKIVGLAVVYCNNELTKRAYISLVGVAAGYRNKGIAKNLVTRAIQVVREQRFTVIGIHSNNPVAIRLYQSFGFELVEPGERAYLELVL